MASAGFGQLPPLDQADEARGPCGVSSMARPRAARPSRMPSATSHCLFARASARAASRASAASAGLSPAYPAHSFRQGHHLGREGRPARSGRLHRDAEGAHEVHDGLAGLLEGGDVGEGDGLVGHLGVHFPDEREHRAQGGAGVEVVVHGRRTNAVRVSRVRSNERARVRAAKARPARVRSAQSRSAHRVLDAHERRVELPPARSSEKSSGLR